MNKKYRILIPVEKDSNPFVSQLEKALIQSGKVEEIQIGLSNQLFLKTYDIILIQWPEAFTGFSQITSASIESIRMQLNQWKESGAKLVATVHNNLPHKNSTPIAKQYYKMIYGSCYALIHLGKVSKTILRNTIQHTVLPENEFVIRHGNYSNFENHIDKSQARAILGLQEDIPVGLVLGNIRKKSELELVFKFAEALQKVGGQLLLCSRLPSKSRRRPSYFLDRMKIKWSKNVVFKEGIIKDEEMQNYLNATDLFLIPRVDALNSGNVALGFTFGKIVVGPQIGVIGEELSDQNNPTFIPNFDESIFESIQKGLSLVGTKRESDNKKYAANQLNWKSIGESYLDVFDHVFHAFED